MKVLQPNTMKRRMALGTLGKLKRNFTNVEGKLAMTEEKKKKILFRFVVIFGVSLDFCLNCCLQWARERREVERDSDFGPEDYFEGALRGGNREDVQMNDFAETMLLISVCIVVSILLYIRTRTVERMRREQRNQGEQQAGNGDRGVFPPPGDPARQDWAIMR